MESTDKTVIVITGASSGIGKATALELAKKQDVIVLASRSEQSLGNVAKECEELGGIAFVVPTDVSHEQEVENLGQKVIEKYGKIDVWINGAAVIAFGNFLEIPKKDFRQVIETNLFGYVYGARVAVRQFKKQGYGMLLNISSVAGVVGQPFAVPYSISKFGIRGLGISLDQELKSEKDIHIGTIILSTIDTPIYRKGANYYGKKIAPPVPVTRASKVAQAIVKLSKNPKERIFVGKQVWLMRLGRFFFPTLFDLLTHKIAKHNQFEKELTQNTSGNLYEPIPEMAMISDGWANKQHKTKKNVRQVILGAGILAGLFILGKTATR